MNWRYLVVLIAVAATTEVQAEETPQQLVVPTGQVIVQVRGVVCSFCAYGTEKNLSKLTFLDRSLFGDGVLMDIHANRITLALDPRKPLDLKGIHQAITKGGYDPVTVYLRLSGTVAKQGNRYVLATPEAGPVFELTGHGLERLHDQQAVNVQAHLDASQIPALLEEQPVKVIVDTLEASS